MKPNQIETLERLFADLDRAADEAEQWAHLMLGSDHPLVAVAQAACRAAEEAHRAARMTAEELRGKDR